MRLGMERCTKVVQRLFGALLGQFHVQQVVGTVCLAIAA
jgi:hypothetical protein